MIDRRAASVVLASVFVLVPVARAQPALSVDASGCDDARRAAIERAVQVELTAADDDTIALVRSGELRVAVRCGDDGIVVRAEHVPRGRSTEQRIEAGAVALERRAALAALELVTALALAPEPSVSVPGIVAAPVARVAPEPMPTPARSAPAPRLWLRLGGGVWIGGAPLVGLGSAALGIEVALDAVVLGLSFGGAFGGWRVDEGTLDVRVLSLAASVLFGATLERFDLRAGPSMRGGAVSWSGRATAPARGRDPVAPWLGIGAAARVGIELAHGWRLDVDVEGGGIVVESAARVLGEIEARVGAAWVEARLSIAIALDGA